MRKGQNPLRNSSNFRPVKELTIALTSYIPVLAGYWKSSLDVLKACIDSAVANTNEPFDLMVFDNGSCESVVEYLQELSDTGTLQFLILSSENVGASAAKGVLLGAAPGELVAYADADVLFQPEWLETEKEVLLGFPDVGMVSGLPAIQNFGHFTNATLKRAQTDPEILVEEGQLVPDEWSIEYSRSLGLDPQAFLNQNRDKTHVRLSRGGVSAYACATHFQFLARTKTIRRVLPLRSRAAVGQESDLDQALDDLGLMRLSVDGMVVRHIGNVLPGERPGLGSVTGSTPEGTRHTQVRKPRTKSKLTSRAVRWAINSIYDWSFRRLVRLDK